MKRWNVVVALLALAVLMAAPAYAEMRLTVTGFIDNHVRYTQNLSAFDDDITNGSFNGIETAPCRPSGCDEEDDWRGRTRGAHLFEYCRQRVLQSRFRF